MNQAQDSIDNRDRDARAMRVWTGALRGRNGLKIETRRVVWTWARTDKFEKRVLSVGNRNIPDEVGFNFGVDGDDR
jgi:hypothetical protein